jgi:hypothetical protein
LNQRNLDSGWEVGGCQRWNVEFVCEEWTNGYSLNTNNEWILNGLETEIDVISGWIAFTILISFLLSVILSFLNPVPSTLPLLPIHHFQLLSLLLIADSHIPSSLSSLTRTNSFTLFLLPFFTHPSKQQQDTDLYNAGFRSIRTIENLLPVVCFLLCFMIFHFVVKMVPKAELDYEVEWNQRIGRSWNYCKPRILIFMYYVFYIRMIMWMNVAVLVSGFEEIRRIDSPTEAVYASITFVALIGWVILVVVTGYYLYRFLKMDKTDDKLWFRELFSGVGNYRWTRSYSFLFLVRRLIFVVLIVFLRTCNRDLLMSLLVIIQFAYLILVITINF